MKPKQEIRKQSSISSYNHQQSSPINVWNQSISRKSSLKSKTPKFSISKTLNLKKINSGLAFPYRDSCESRVLVAVTLVPGVSSSGGGHGELAAASLRSVEARAMARHHVTREGERERERKGKGERRWWWWVSVSLKEMTERFFFSLFVCFAGRVRGEEGRRRLNEEK